MYLYDTSTRSVRPLEVSGPTAPASPLPRVGLYVCGITPYDSAHLGHAFTNHVFDVLTRRLRALHVAVRSVRNVTDVDDDMLRVARERGVDYLELAEREVAAYDREMASIDILPVDSAPR